MYTVREDASRDFVGTLRKVAEMGYEGVELAGKGGLGARELRDVLDDLGLGRAGSHEGLEALEGDIQAVVDYNLELGNPYIVCPGVPEERRNSADAWRALADVFNRVGEECHRHGLKFAYHNHHMEFQKFEGKYGLDILVERTDPRLVYLEVDTYWARYAGVDPAWYIRERSDRVLLVHLKDMADDEKRNRTYVQVQRWRAPG